MARTSGTAAEPDAFGDLRLRVAVHGGRGGVAASREDVLQACSRGSEFPGGEDHVPGACVAASLEVRVGRAADGRDVDRQADSERVVSPPASVTPNSSDSSR